MTWQLYNTDDRRVLCDECAGDYAEYINHSSGWNAYRCADCMKRRRDESGCDSYAGTHYYEAPLPTCKCGKLRPA
jgi:hypothetical protein